MRRTPRPITLVKARFYIASRAVVDSERPHGDARDMLRYDGAFVSVYDPRLVMCPSLRVPRGVTYDRTPTLGRWQTFNVTLTRTDMPDVGSTEDWVTYRRPRNAGGGHDDSAPLERVTLATVLASTDLDM